MADNWTTITNTPYTWESEALEFIRSQLPPHEPYRAWANFEFIALDGSINEVDLLVFTSVGFFLIEIKSRPGLLSGDAGTWTWRTDGKIVTCDNPIFAADLKAKKLKSLLQQQRIAKRGVAVPYMDALVFCSDPNLQSTLTGTAASHICLRDRKAGIDGEKARPGIMAAIKSRECEGLKSRVFGDFNTPTSRMISQALKLAGVRPSQRHRKVGDYQLDTLIGEGRGYQDWSASHVLLQNSKRRIRIYNIRTNASPDELNTHERAARREAELLEGLQHPGVLKREGYTPHELGPALIFEYDPAALRLDHYISQCGDSLSAADRCKLLRDIAEVVRYAHERQTYHRGLAPQSILVNPANPLSRVKIFNWQSGFRGQRDDITTSKLVSATSHLERLVDDAASAYVAPEALSNQETQGEKQDLFSLGAIAYYLFSGHPPAANGIELSEKLRVTDGLQISSVMSGAKENLNTLIQWTTSPIVAERIESASDFLDLLTHVESDFKTSEHDYVDDPNIAEPLDTFPENYTVLQRIGSGASSIAFLVERDEPLILKVARDPEFNDRLQDEGEILDKFRHARIAEYVATIDIGKFRGLLIRPTFTDKRKLKIETLRARLKEDGALHLDMLQRFGDDLLNAVAELEENGVSHRDIKPDNIAIGQVRSGDQLHAVLFDFSLAKMSPENINAGTPGYLDPMLPLRKSKRFDSYAERYSAAVTLYQMATGHKNFPNWSPDGTDPTHLDSDGLIDPDLFDANVRDTLTDFFERSFRRDLKLRHDNAEQMKNEWNACFANLEDAGNHSDHLDEEAFQQRLESATPDTLVTELGLGMRAVVALDKNQISDVRQLLATPVSSIHRMRGVGKSTVNLIKRAIRTLQKRFGASLSTALIAIAPENGPEVDEVSRPERLSVDQIMHHIQRVGATQPMEARTSLAKYLAIDESIAKAVPIGQWPSLQQLSELTGASHVQLRKWIDTYRNRWDKDVAITRVRADLDELVETLGGVATVEELASALLASRGSHQTEPIRTRYAVAVVCAALEVETYKSEPRFVLRRGEHRLLIATDAKLSHFAIELGAAADSLSAEVQLVSPARALEQLRVLANQYEVSFSDARLVRLAASASRASALSSRNEFYPRQMEATRAIRLSQSALYGTSQLTVRQIRDRVQSRYPLCAPIPDQPELERILREAGFDYRWDDSLAAFVSSSHDPLIISTGSDSFSRFSTNTKQPVPVGETDEEFVIAQQFEEKLMRARNEGSYLAIVVEPKDYQQAIDELSHKRFGVEVIDVEGLFLDLMREVTVKAQVEWDLILETDREPGKGDWSNLLLLVKRVIPKLVEAVLENTGKNVLLIYPSLLGRYDQLSVLNDLQQEVGRRLKGLWLLLPGSSTAMIGREAVSIVTPNQSTVVPLSWLKNRHRGGGIGSGGQISETTA